MAPSQLAHCRAGKAFLEHPTLISPPLQFLRLVPPCVLPSKSLSVCMCFLSVPHKTVSSTWTGTWSHSLLCSRRLAQEAHSPQLAERMNRPHLQSKWRGNLQRNV